jgi:2-dehydropantoate 2-reductase
MLYWETSVKLPPLMRSSMQKDVAAGRPPELDAIAGPILCGAEKFGLQASATRAFVQEIKSAWINLSRNTQAPGG